MKQGRIFKRGGAEAGLSRRLALPLQLRTLPVVLLASLLISGASSLTASAPEKTPAALEGTLLSVPGKGPFLKTSSKEYALAGKTHYMYHTLMDKRLADRQVRVEGEFKPDGTFEVQWLYTIKDGKLYRVRYFCDVCNIEALEPGNCVCCQQPTEIQEIPVNKGHI